MNGEGITESAPEEVKILSNIGVFPDWEVTQHREHEGDEEPDPRVAAENQEPFKLRNLPNFVNYSQNSCSMFYVLVDFIPISFSPSPKRRPSRDQGTPHLPSPPRSPFAGTGYTGQGPPPSSLHLALRLRARATHPLAQ